MLKARIQWLLVNPNLSAHFKLVYVQYTLIDALIHEDVPYIRLSLIHVTSSPFNARNVFNLTEIFLIRFQIIEMDFFSSLDAFFLIQFEDILSCWRMLKMWKWKTLLQERKRKREGETEDFFLIGLIFILLAVSLKLLRKWILSKEKLEMQKVFEQINWKCPKLLSFFQTATEKSLRK